MKKLLVLCLIIEMLTNEIDSFELFINERIVVLFLAYSMKNIGECIRLFRDRLLGIENLQLSISLISIE